MTPKHMFWISAEVMMFSSCYARGRFHQVSRLKVWKSCSYSCSNASFEVCGRLFFSHVELWEIIFFGSHLFLNLNIICSNKPKKEKRANDCINVNANWNMSVSFPSPFGIKSLRASHPSVLISGRLCSARSLPDSGCSWSVITSSGGTMWLEPSRIIRRPNHVDVITEQRVLPAYLWSILWKRLHFSEA